MSDYAAGFGLPDRPIVTSVIEPELRPLPLGDPTLSDDAKSVLKLLYKDYAEQCGWIDGTVSEEDAIARVQDLHCGDCIQFGQERAGTDVPIRCLPTPWFQRWCDAIVEVASVLNSTMALELPNGSKFQKLIESYASQDLAIVKGGDVASLKTFLEPGAGIFLIEHNWADALKSAEIGATPEIKLPFSRCVFEFRIGGKNVCALVSEEIDGIEIIVETKCGWHVLQPGLMRYAAHITKKDFNFETIGVDVGRLRRLINDQINGALIALDATIAETEVIRAPVKLNAARVKRGRAPLPDYRVIKLAHRHRVSLINTSSWAPSRRVRLHFRRGHWRHFDAHKTWINWMLVGNPDLGFIEKHYRL